VLPNWINDGHAARPFIWNFHGRYEMKNCLICDDHALVREALVGTVRMNWPQADVWQAGDFVSAWELAAQQPDLCIADLIMPGAGPMAGITGIMKASPSTKVLVVTGTQDDALLMELLKAGVAGFAPKSASGAIIEAAIRLVLAGGRYLPPRLADIAASRVEFTLQQDAVAGMAREPRQNPGSDTGGGSGSGTGGGSGASPAVPVADSADESTAAGAGSPDRLTARQIDVLKLVSEGQSNKEIARVLGLAPSTVKTHLENLLSALGVSNRTEASDKARRMNLL
jgi:DNA-binding NarL/FixJ family response regulator